MSEQSAETQIKHLVAETEAVKSIQQRWNDDESAWNEQKRQEEDALKARRGALEEEYDHRKKRDERLMESLEEQVSSLRLSLQDLDNLEEVVHAAGTESLRKECEALRKRCDTAEEALNAERAAAQREHEQREHMENLSMGELRQYRNKFHHLRRVATNSKLPWLLRREHYWSKLKTLPLITRRSVWPTR